MIKAPDFTFSTHQNDYKAFLYRINITHHPISKVKYGGGFYQLDYHPMLFKSGQEEERDVDHPITAFWGLKPDSPICTLQYNVNHRRNFCLYRLAAAFPIEQINQDISMAIHLYRYTDVIAAVKLFLLRGEFDDRMPRIVHAESSISVKTKMAEVEKNAKIYDPEYRLRADKIRKDYKANDHRLESFLIE